MSKTNGQQGINQIVTILSLRCHSLISLKLYNINRVSCNNINSMCSDFFKNTHGGEGINSNTPSLPLTPPNSEGSQDSDSNTPSGRIIPSEIHSGLYRQNQYLKYLCSAHDLWDEAEALMVQANCQDFFAALDAVNGPLSLHSSMYTGFHYLQAALQKLKDSMSTISME